MNDMAEQNLQPLKSSIELLVNVLKQRDFENQNLKEELKKLNQKYVCRAEQEQHVCDSAPRLGTFHHADDVDNANGDQGDVGDVNKVDTHLDCSGDTVNEVDVLSNAGDDGNITCELVRADAGYVIGDPSGTGNTSNVIHNHIGDEDKVIDNIGHAGEVGNTRGELNSLDEVFYSDLSGQSCEDTNSKQLAKTNVLKPENKVFRPDPRFGYSAEEQERRRQCISLAIKKNCPFIVECTLWFDIVDELIAKHCLLESEHNLISNLRKGNDNQMRTLIVMMICRDKVTLERFLATLKTSTPHVAEKIEESVDVMLKENVPIEDICLWCSLRSRVNLILIADYLYSAGVVGNKFYTRVSMVDMLDGNDEIWERFDNEVDTDKFEELINVFVEGLEKVGFYADIVSKLKNYRDMKENCFRCRCGPQMNVLKEIEFNSVGKDSGLVVQRQTSDLSEFDTAELYYSDD